MTSGCSFPDRRIEVRAREVACQDGSAAVELATLVLDREGRGHYPGVGLALGVTDLGDALALLERARSAPLPGWDADGWALLGRQGALALSAYRDRLGGPTAMLLRVDPIGGAVWCPLDRLAELEGLLTAAGLSLARCGGELPAPAAPLH